MITTEKPKAKPSLHVTRFKSAEYERSVWVVTPEVGVQVEDLLEPSYWAHVAAKMRPYDKIEVCADDGSYYGEYLVLSTGPGYARIHQLWVVDLDAEMPEEDADDTTYIKWLGKTKRWGVLRKTDNFILKDGHENKTKAMKWAIENQSSMAA